MWKPLLPCDQEKASRLNAFSWFTIDHELAPPLPAFAVADVSGKVWSTLISTVARKSQFIDNPQSTLCNLHCAIYIVQRAIDNLQSTLCNVRSTIYNPCCATCDGQSTIHVVWAPKHAQSRHLKWTTDDCRAIVLVEALELKYDCA